MPERDRPRFEDLTETTGIPISPEGAEMMYTRYHYAAELARGKRVLELGCGSGQGLRLIGARARSVLGGDYSRALLRSGRRHYGAAQRFVQLSADALPFRSSAFDLVLFFEGSYYVRDMDAAFRDIGRVLAPGGTVVFVNANPERPDFIRSPHSVHYHSGDEFRAALSSLGFQVRVEGAFPTDEVTGGTRSPFVSDLLLVARKVLEGLGLVPRTLRGRARIKRLLYGKLPEVPAELPEDFAPVAPRTAVPAGRIAGFKVLYVTATRNPAAA